MTTLTILLSVLRDLTTNDERRLERRRYVYQKGSIDLQTEDRYTFVELFGHSPLRGRS